MYEIKPKDGDQIIVRDGDEFFPLPKDATYNGEKVKPFRTNDVYLATDAWNRLGVNDYDMVVVRDDG